MLEKYTNQHVSLKEDATMFVNHHMLISSHKNNIKEQLQHVHVSENVVVTSNIVQSHAFFQ